MRRIRSRATASSSTRRVGTLKLRAYPRPAGPELPPQVMSSNLFARTNNASEENRRRFGRSISMDMIEHALRAAHRGSMRDLTDILRETVETDPHLGSILNKRFGSVANLPWDIQPASGAGIDRDKAMFYAEVVRAQIRNMKTFRKNLAQLAWALFDGRSCLELQWVMIGPDAAIANTRFGSANMAVKEMDWIHPRRLSFGPQRELRIQAETTPGGGNFMATGLDVREYPDKFIWWMPQLFGEYPEREGLGIRCMYWSFFKRFAARERMILSELYGKPWRIITVDEESSAGGDDLTDADQIVDALGSTHTARLPRGTNLQVIAPGKSAGQVHQEIIETSDKQNSKLVLGQTGTTDAVPAGLNSNQANVMQDEQLGVLIHDASELSEIIESYITDRIIAVNFGEMEVTHAPTFTLRADLPADRVAELLRLDAALKAGLSIGRNEAYELSGFSIPDEQEVVLRMEQPPTPPNSPVAPAIRPMVIYPTGTTPDVGQQQPAASEADAAPGTEAQGATAGAAAAEATITVNEERAARGLGPLMTPEGSEDPRGNLTIVEFKNAGEQFPEGEEPPEEPSELEPPPAPAPEATPAEPPPQEPAKQAMSGGQITSLIDIVERYRSGSLPRESAHEMLVAIFPVTADQASRMLGPELEAPAPAPTPEPPEVEEEGEEPEEEDDDDEPGEEDEDEPDEETPLAIAAAQHRAEITEWNNWVAKGHPVTVQLEVGQDQDRTANGSPEDYVARGMSELLRETNAWVADFESAIEGETTATGIFTALARKAADINVTKFGRALERRKLQSLMLGALDSNLEIVEANEGDETEGVQAALSTMTKVMLASDGDEFTKKPFKSALRHFKSLNVLNRTTFEVAQASIKRRSFTVAGVLRDQMLRTIQDELAKAVAAGKDLRRFKNLLRPRMRSAGFIPEMIGAPGRQKPALSASHVETVYRTNVLNTYNTGRFVHQTSPNVQAAFPVWEFRAVKDDRTRDTHGAVHGKRLMANDVFWQSAYPPYGYNCRCRVVPRSAKYLNTVVSGTSISGLPDPGFTSGSPALALE